MLVRNGLLTTNLPVFPDSNAGNPKIQSTFLETFVYLQEKSFFKTINRFNGQYLQNNINK
jgi:hypothetical protein